jgi:hypothetical protein
MSIMAGFGMIERYEMNTEAYTRSVVGSIPVARSSELPVEYHCTPATLGWGAQSC